MDKSVILKRAKEPRRMDEPIVVGRTGNRRTAHGGASQGENQPPHPHAHRTVPHSKTSHQWRSARMRVNRRSDPTNEDVGCRDEDGQRRGRCVAGRRRRRR